MEFYQFLTLSFVYINLRHCELLWEIFINIFSVRKNYKPNNIVSDGKPHAVITYSYTISIASTSHSFYTTYLSNIFCFMQL